jgi:glycosyltransferase involved in cell wall biosynthesis
MKRVLFLSFSGYSEHNGISKKKLAQIKGLKECGCDVTNCYYMVDSGTGHRLWMADGSIVIDLGTGIGAKIRKRIDYSPILTYIKQQRISFVYMRSEHNASPFLISFVRRLRNSGVKIVMEIPTYPYDQEYDTFKGKCLLFVDKICRKNLAKQLNAIVTFSNEPIIFGQRTIRISNGIDFHSILSKQHNKGKSNEIHLIAVAEIHYWHGWDRIVAGLANYYQSVRHHACKVYLHLVGEFSGERERNEIMPLIVENQLNNYVTLHGKLFGKELDEIFDRADVGVGSLARHRSNITRIKTLKNREYAARGIPFIYSEIDDDFEEMPYIMKIPADESPVDIHQVINFYNRITMSTEEIRNSVRHLSWKNQMKKVLDSIEIAVYENKNSLR